MNKNEIVEFSLFQNSLVAADGRRVVMHVVRRIYLVSC